MAPVVSLRKFDAAAYAFVGKHAPRSAEAVRADLIALAKTAKLDGIQSELAGRDADTLVREAPKWVAKMRRTVHRAASKSAPALATNLLAGARLVHAAREPWRAARIAIKREPDRDAATLFEARRDALFRTPPVRDPKDFVDGLAAQICELTTFTAVTKYRPVDLADVDKRVSYIVRNVGHTIKASSPELRVALERLAVRVAKWPELPLIAAAVAHVRSLDLPAAKASHIHRDEETLPGVRYAVVVGAGPAGLAAAVELASRGVAVDLIDARDPWSYTRPVQMVVKQSGLDQMKHLGILDAVKPHLSATTYDYEENPETWRAEPVLGGRPADAHRKTRSGEIFAGSRSLYAVTLNAVEDALFQRCLELGVRPISNATIGFGRVRGSGSTTSRTVYYQRGEANGPRFKTYGRRHPLGTPDLVLIAEGGRSQRRRAFRVPWDTDERMPKRGLAGLVRVDIGATTHTWSESESEQKNVVISVGHATSGATWTLAEVPRDRRIKDKNEAARFFLERASRALSVPLKRSDLLFGGTSLFTIENRAVRRAAFAVSERQAVFAIGDSKGIGSPMVGLGMQYGISVDALSVGRFVDNVSQFGFRQSAAIFNATTREDLHAWHKRWV